VSNYKAKLSKEIDKRSTIAVLKSSMRYLESLGKTVIDRVYRRVLSRTLKGIVAKCKGEPCNTPIYWLQSPISAVALILMYFLAIWRSGALHYYNYISATTWAQEDSEDSIHRVDEFWCAHCAARSLDLLAWV
jgi:hypothetical protein